MGSAFQGFVSNVTKYALEGRRMKSKHTIRNLSNLLRTRFGKRRRIWFLAVAAAIALLGGMYFYHGEVPQVLAQSAISSLNDAMVPASGQRILVFSPHPDDETIGVGGYIAQSRKDGADVRIVLVTDGNRHNQKDLRYSEFKKATGILGVPESDLVFLNFPDGKLREQSESALYEAFKEQIDSYSPDIVIYPHPRDANPDHSTTGRIVEEILRAESQKRIAYEYLVHYELLYPRLREFDPKFYLLPPKHLLALDPEWQQFPLSQDTEDLKGEAILTYKSQLNDRWLKGLLLSSIRRNELLAVPKGLGAQ
jgi:LmbE family N-acetylglucosaminyl deacetylase